MEKSHREQILDQFTRQAAPFASSEQIRNEEALGRIVEMAQPSLEDTVLDVACGPGLLACAFARVARRVSGIDLTPKMLEQAKELQQKQGLENLSWQEGDVQALPYRDATFSIVASRFAFHHFRDPLAVLKEMRRVCRPDGRIVIADSVPESGKAEAFNRMEKLRDPSHVRALSLEEFLELFAAAGLQAPRTKRDLLPYELEGLLRRSFPKDGDADRIRELFEESLETDSLGVVAFRENGRIRFLFPTAIFASSVA